MRGFQKAQLDQAVANVPQVVRDQIAAEAIGGQKVVLPLPYWSTIRLQAVRSGPGPFTYTIDTSDRRAFQYGQGSDCSVGGFASGTIATGAETNLLKPGESISNADVFIYGMAVELCPNSEPLLASQVWRDSWLELSLNGQDSVKLGTLNMFPGASGLFGAAPSRLLAPPDFQAGSNDGGIGPALGFLSNGNPMAGNFYRFPQPFVWRAVGQGRDSNLAVIWKSARTIAFNSTDRVLTAGAAPGLSGRVEPHTSPAATAGTLGTFLDIRIRLVSVSVSPRSINT